MDETRRVRVGNLPTALRQALGRDCALVVHSNAVDECRYDIFEVRPDGRGVIVSRHVWWFDEEVQQWLLDEASEWFLAGQEAMQLGVAIQHAGLPAQRKAAV